MSEEKFDFGAMLNAQFQGMNKNSIRYAKADREEPVIVYTAAEAEDGPVLDASLKQAFEQNLPIDGKVEKEVKGGYEVTIQGQRGFCGPEGLLVRHGMAALVAGHPGNRAHHMPVFGGDGYS